MVERTVPDNGSGVYLVVPGGLDVISEERQPDAGSIHRGVTGE